MSFAHTQEHPLPEPPAISPNLFNECDNRPTGSNCQGDISSENESLSASSPRSIRWRNISTDRDIVCWDFTTLAFTTTSQLVWQRMQHGFTDNVLALGQSRGGRGTPGFDTRYCPQENMQTTFHSQNFRQYDTSKNFPTSPASIADSDHSDHSDHSYTSVASSQTDISELGRPSPTFDLQAKESRNTDNTKHEDGRTTCSAASPIVTDAQPTYLAGLGCVNYGLAYIKSEDDTSSKNSDDTDNKFTTNIKEESKGECSSEISRSYAEKNICTQDQPRADATWLPYRSRAEYALDTHKTSTCIDTLEDSKLHLKQEQPSTLDLKPPNWNASNQTQKPRCYLGLLNPCTGTGVSSSQIRSTDSPQNQQINTRRRPINSTLPPPTLRRDTDNTDAIVRMIVIFCTNLIQSIWPADNTVASPSCNGSSQSGGNVLPLQVFITETLRRSKTSYSTLQIALFYLILLKQCLPELANPGQTGQSGCRAMLCGRRMFLTALILASKYLQDRNYSARAWSKISGLPMKEINDNERRYLRFVGWDLHVPKEAFENWSKIVLAICRLSTGQDFNGQDSQYPPPSPGMGPISQTTRKEQLQDMCPKTQMYAVRAWWVFNLQALRTDVVRCPRRTEQYVLSIPHLQAGPRLLRPLFASNSSESTLENMAEDKVLPPVHKLSRPSSMDFTENASQHVTGTRVLGASSKSMPPPPPMLGFLPTPQTTPRSDMTDTWKPSQSRSGSRCRDSASLLRNLDRTCPSTTAEKFPASNCALPTQLSYYSGTNSQDSKSSLSQSSPGIWLQRLHKARELHQTPDRSLTSSPESIVSDLSSLSSFVGRSRTSSFSSTSSRSMMSRLNTVTSDPERCEGFKQQLNSLDAQIAPQVQNWRNASIDKEADCYTPQAISRPQTAFRTSFLRPGYVEESVKLNETDSDSVADEGYWSSDHAQEKREEKKKQTAAHALLDMQNRLESSQSMVTVRNMENIKPKFLRPTMTRSNTQVYAPERQSVASHQQTLKRSRSESFDTNVESSVPGSTTCNTSYAQTRNVQQSCQPWAGSKQPVFSGTQDTNKRIAVQSAAATQASMDLRREASAWFDSQHSMPGSVRYRGTEDSLFNKPSWQPSTSRLRETLAPSVPSNVCLLR